MKWFKHDVDMHTDFRMIELMQKHGLIGYAVWNICLEFLGKEGERLHSNNRKFQLNAGKNWKNHVKRVTNLENGTVDEVLQTLADMKLICSKSLKRGVLYCPGFVKRADDYTARKLRTISEHTTDNVPLDKNRIDKIRTEYITIKGYKETDLKPDDFARLGKAIKDLVLKANDDNLVIAGLHWIAEKNYEWTLETLLKKWPDFLLENNKTPFERKWLNAHRKEK